MTSVLPERHSLFAGELTDRWVGVCLARDLIPGRGVCAVIDGRQVAVILAAACTTSSRARYEIYALSNRDPFSGAFVLSRGIVGSRTVDGVEVPTLQSPLYKQAFDLRTGRCLDDPTVVVRAYHVRLRSGVVEVLALQDPEHPAS